MNITSEKLKAVLSKYGVNLTDDVDHDSIEVKESPEVAERLDSLQNLLRAQLNLQLKRNKAESDLQKLDLSRLNDLNKEHKELNNDIKSKHDKSNDANIDINEIEDNGTESDSVDTPNSSFNPIKSLKKLLNKGNLVKAGIAYLVGSKLFASDKLIPTEVSESELEDRNQYRYEIPNQSDNSDASNPNPNIEIESESTNDNSDGLWSKIRKIFRREDKVSKPNEMKDVNVDFSKLKGDNAEGYTKKGGYLTQSQMDNNMKIIMNYLHNEMKLPIPAVLAIAGNIAQESGANPGAYNVKEKAGTYKGSRANGPDYGAGIIQWTGVGNNPGVGDRKLRMENYLGKKVEDSSLIEQLHYLKYEMSTTMKSGYDKFLSAVRSTNDVNKLTSAWLASIEMPGLWKYYVSYGNTKGKGEEAKRISHAAYYQSKISELAIVDKPLLAKGTESDVSNFTKPKSRKITGDTSVIGPKNDFIATPTEQENIQSNSSKKVVTQTQSESTIIQSPTKEIHNEVINNIYES